MVLSTFFHLTQTVDRDPCWFNLMMDASNIIPRGTHFAAPDTHDGFSRSFKWRQRWSVRPIQYYYIDFDISRRYHPEARNLDLKEMSRAGQDRTAPEFKKSGPYNPFKVDVYQLGNAILKLIDVGSLFSDSRRCFNFFFALGIQSRGIGTIHHSG